MEAFQVGGFDCLRKCLNRKPLSRDRCGFSHAFAAVWVLHEIFGTGSKFVLVCVLPAV